jgi:membrane-anchored protein YejM (alkaline phosphatase superfamily)
MKNQLASILCEQPYLQPFGHHEISFNHEHIDIWHDNGIKGMFYEFLASYLEPIKSSFYIPRLVVQFPAEEERY